ncbi:MAG: hypothetical protein WD078_05295 [Woeseia sp.]
MNGFEFNHIVLQPWVRDPAFYQSIWTYKSDVPAHEGPTHHTVLELWTYRFPLSDSEEQRMVRELKVILPLMRQAQENLTGNARDLWRAGINNIRNQRENLDNIEATVGPVASRELARALGETQAATDEFIRWLEAKLPGKDGQSGVGKDNYSWYLQQVHYVPLDREDEVRLLERELDRAWSSLKLEEHRNRDLPPQEAASTPEEYDALADRKASELIASLRDNEVMPVKDNMEPALRQRPTINRHAPAD